jgi:hypothetical protein
MPVAQSQTENKQSGGVASESYPDIEMQPIFTGSFTIGNVGANWTYRAFPARA